MTDNNFIQQFEEKIKQFNELRSTIDTTINMKRNFTQKLKERLKGISERTYILYGLIGELKKNKDNFERQLNDNKTNIQNNTGEMNAIKAKISALENEKATMEQRLKEQESEISNKINEKQTEVQKKQSLQNELKSLQQQITQLQTENQRLSTENQRLQTENRTLQEKIKAATQLIQTAIEYLTKLMNEEPNANTQQEFEPILKSIMETIEGSIRLINDNNNLSAPAQQSSNNTFSKLSIEQVTRDNIDDVLNNLQKYNDSLNENSNEKKTVAKAINDINSQRYNSSLTNEKLKQFYNNAFQKGGKRTRKMRKNKMRKTKKQKKNKKQQKGGFIYNTNTKRSKLKTSRFKSSNRTRTYSSKTSSPRTKSTF